MARGGGGGGEKERSCRLLEHGGGWTWSLVRPSAPVCCCSWRSTIPYRSTSLWCCVAVDGASIVRQTKTISGMMTASWWPTKVIIIGFNERRLWKEGRYHHDLLLWRETCIFYGSTHGSTSWDRQTNSITMMWGWKKKKKKKKGRRWISLEYLLHPILLNASL